MHFPLQLAIHVQITMGAVNTSVSSATEHLMVVWATVASAGSATFRIWMTTTALVRNHFWTVFLTVSTGVCAALGLGQLPVALLHRK